MNEIYKKIKILLKYFDKDDIVYLIRKKGIKNLKFDSIQKIVYDQNSSISNEVLIKDINDFLDSFLESCKEFKQQIDKLKDEIRKIANDNFSFESISIDDDSIMTLHFSNFDLLYDIYGFSEPKINFNNKIKEELEKTFLDKHKDYEVKSAAFYDEDDYLDEFVYEDEIECTELKDSLLLLSKTGIDEMNQAISLMNNLKEIAVNVEKENVIKKCKTLLDNFEGLSFIKENIFLFDNI